jgi:hypothetical protein
MQEENDMLGNRLTNSAGMLYNELIVKSNYIAILMNQIPFPSSKSSLFSNFFALP